MVRLDPASAREIVTFGAGPGVAQSVCPIWGGTGDVASESSGTEPSREAGAGGATELEASREAGAWKATGKGLSRRTGARKAMGEGPSRRTGAWKAMGEGPSRRTGAAGVSAPYSGAGVAGVSPADSVVGAGAAAGRSGTGTGTEADTGTAATGGAAAQSGVETSGADLEDVALVGAGMSSFLAIFSRRSLSSRQRCRRSWASLLFSSLLRKGSSSESTPLSGMADFLDGADR